MMSKGQLVLILGLCVPNFLQNVIVSINGPLFPIEAESKGLTPIEYGSILSSFRLALAISVIFITVYVKNRGLRHTFLIGIFFNGLAPLLFGFLHYVESADAFLTLAIVIRTLEAIGAVGFLIPLYIMTISLFKDNVAFALGVVQASYSLGTFIGPFLGAVVEPYTGFPGPYIFFGCLQIITSGIAFIFIPRNKFVHQSNQDVSIFRSFLQIILQRPTVLIYVFACVITGVGPDFLYAILEPNLRQFDLSSPEIGLIFLLFAIGQFFGPLWGLLMDRMDKPQGTLIFAATFMIISIVFLGPFPGIEPELWMTVVGIIIFGIAQGLFPVSAIVNLRLQALPAHSEESDINKSFVTMVYLEAASIGAAIAPITAGFLFQNYGFPVATLFLLFLNLILIPMVLMNCLSISCNVSNYRENSPLLVPSSKTSIH